MRLSGLAPEIKALGVSETTTAYKRSTNPLLGFELKANHRDEDSDARSSYDYTNAHGQRDVERSVEKPPGTTRIILLGDSVVEGHGIREIDDTISRQLERLYPDGTTEVLNFGVSAYCTRAEVELLETKGLRFDPDVVILIFVENDFDNFNAETWELGSEGDRPRWAQQLFHGSALFRLLCVRLNLYGFGVEVDPVGWNTRAIGDNNVADGFQRLRELADSREFQPIIAIWPRFEDDSITNVHFMPGSDRELVVERLAQIYGLPTVRLSDAFERDHQAAEGRGNPRRLYSDGDGMHPSVEGCRVAARALRTILDLDPSTLLPDSGPRSTSQDRAVLATAGSRSAVDPGYSIVANTRGTELLAEGRIDEAVDSFRLALDENPDFAEAHTNLGVALGAQGRTSEAIESYRRAIAIRPDLVTAHRNLGLALAAGGDTTGAIEHLRRAVELDPGDVAAHNNLGGALTTLGRLDEAAIEYQKAIDLRPDYVMARYNLGSVMERLGRLNEALDQFREADRLRPHWQPAMRRVAWILATRPDAATSDREEAREWALRARELSGEVDAAMLDTLAAAEASTGRFAEAVAAAEAALAIASGEEQAAAIRYRLELYHSRRPYIKGSDEPLEEPLKTPGTALEVSERPGRAAPSDR